MRLLLESINFLNARISGRGGGGGGASGPPPGAMVKEAEAQVALDLCTHEGAVLLGPSTIPVILTGNFMHE